MRRELMADIDLIAAGFAADMRMLRAILRCRFICLKIQAQAAVRSADPSAWKLEAFADAEMPPDVLEQVWRLAMERRDVPVGRPVFG